MTGKAVQGVLESLLKMTREHVKSAERRAVLVVRSPTNTLRPLFALCKLCAFGAFGPVSQFRHGFHVAGGSGTPPSSSQTSSCGLQAFKHSRLNPELSLWSAAAALRWLVTPFIVRDRDLSSGPNVVAGLALPAAADGFLACMP